MIGDRRIVFAQPLQRSNLCASHRQRRWLTYLSYQVLADWASHGLDSAILPRSKIAPHISKQQIFKSNQPAKISFEARWLLRDNKPLKKMMRHFRNNMGEIARGMAN